MSEPAPPSEAEEPQQFRYTVVPDSADARLFLELSGYANADLSVAQHAIEAALKLESAGDPDMIARYLIEFGIVAYCRAFFPSNVRGRLYDHVEIPPEFRVLHEEVRSFRNTTVAHSQSELSTTWPVAMIDESGTPRVREISALNVSQTFPAPRVERLLLLIETLIDRIDELIEPVRARLMTEMRSGPMPQGTATLPGLGYTADTDFTAQTHRRPYPTHQTLYWSATE